MVADFRFPLAWGWLARVWELVSGDGELSTATSLSIVAITSFIFKTSPSLALTDNLPLAQHLIRKLLFHFPARQ
jgi:hypothetical protein